MKTATNKIDSRDLNSCLIRVERSYRNLLQFKDKMNSYLCEPTTYNQFEVYQNLCNKMDTLTRGHLELLKKLQEKKDSMEYEVSKIKGQLGQVKRLEEGISSYMTIAHH